MAKFYILNSAVITTPGNYYYQLIPLQKAIEWLKTHQWESTLGYQETADALEALTGIRIPVNRKLIRMQTGDEALIFRLTKRLDNVDLKGKVGVQFVMDNCEIGILKKLG